MWILLEFWAEWSRSRNTLCSGIKMWNTAKYTWKSKKIEKWPWSKQARSSSSSSSRPQSLLLLLLQLQQQRAAAAHFRSWLLMVKEDHQTQLVLLWSISSFLNMKQAVRRRSNYTSLAMMKLMVSSCRNPMSEAWWIIFSAPGLSSILNDHQGCSTMRQQQGRSRIWIVSCQDQMCKWIFFLNLVPSRGWCQGLNLNPGCIPISSSIQVWTILRATGRSFTMHNQQDYGGQMIMRSIIIIIIIIISIITDSQRSCCMHITILMSGIRVSKIIEHSFKFYTARNRCIHALNFVSNNCHIVPTHLFLETSQVCSQPGSSSCKLVS